MGKHRLAVYHIGDGTMNWQMKAERSLFYRNYGAYETKATGILLICDNDCGETVARNIIRQTMWQRRQLIHTRSGYERDRPVAYVHAPIRLSWYFEHAYFCECKDLAQRLKEIRDEAAVITEIRGDPPPCREPKNGDFERWPERVFVNSACDLLKYIYLFSAVQSLRRAKEEALIATDLQYAMICQKSDFPILRIYPELLDLKELSIRVFTYE